MKAIGEAIYAMNAVGANTTEVSHKRVSARTMGLLENWFRDSIFQNPELVIAPCRAGGLVPEGEIWMPWEIEYHVPDAGRIDVLLISSSGRIGLVETKLSFNPEQRREVVAQLLEYALALQSLDWSDFEDMLPKGETAPSLEDFAEKLAAGEFLLIVAGDDLDERAVRLSQGLLGRHLTSGWDLAMVDLNLFQSQTNPESMLIVPALRGALLADKRQVVRVMVENSKGNSVSVERLPPTIDTGRARDIQSDADFLSTARAQDPGRAHAIEKMYSKFLEIAAAHPDDFECGLRSSSANLYWKSEVTMRIFGLSTAGRFRIKLEYLTKNGKERIVEAIRATAAPVMGVSISDFETTASLFVDDRNVDTLSALVSRIASTILR